MSCGNDGKGDKMSQEGTKEPVCWEPRTRWKEYGSFPEAEE